MTAPKKKPAPKDVNDQVEGAEGCKQTGLCQAMNPLWLAPRRIHDPRAVEKAAENEPILPR